MIYDKNAVMDFLPHRPPFLFVDSIEEVHLVKGCERVIDPLDSKSYVGSFAVGHFLVNEDLEILQGHFPGNPILPGVVQVEMGGQVCPFIFRHAFPNEMKNYDLNVTLLGVDKTRFRKPIVPGMNLRLKGELVKARGDYMNFQCEIQSGDEMVCSSELFALLDFRKKEISDE